MSQIIELIWRNRAYEEATRDPVDGQPNRKGAMFAGFKTEMGFDSETHKSTSRLRQEYLAYDRLCCYPGAVRDSTNEYCIGPQHGVDPASLNLPYNLQYPRTVATDLFRAGSHRHVADTTESGWHATPDEAASRHKKLQPTTDYSVNPGMVVRKRSRNDVDSELIAPEYTTLKFADDISYANAADTTVSIDLQESIAGVNAVLKKVVVQCSKAEHHISEITLDFSDITRGSGSISSSENPQSNLLTILMDGHEKLHTAHFDCKMGKFQSSKLKFAVRNVKYFPPMACEAGGFDCGSQIAVPDSVTFNCERVGTTNVAASLPNTLRGIPDDPFTSTISTGNNTREDISGRSKVSDAVNQGYRLVGDGRTDQATTTTNGSYIPNDDNLTTVSYTDKTEIKDDVKVAWRQPGVSEYKFKQRTTRGTILAISVFLQADVVNERRLL